jgi:hypothetical protein
VVTVSVLLTIRIFEARSLKDKRAVVRSLVERLQHAFRISAAEVGLQDDHRRAEVGYAVVSASPSVARSVAEEALAFAERELIGRAEIIDVARDEQMLG